MEEDNSHVSLLLELDLSESLSLGHHVLVLDSHDTSAPVSSEGIVVVELSSEVLGEGLEVLVVFLSHISHSNAGSGLLVDELTESCLALDEGVGDALLSAEGGEEAHEFNGVNVVSDGNELGLTFLDEGGNVVKTELEDVGLGSLLGITASLLGFSLLLESGLLLLLGLGLVFCKQFKKL